MHCKLVEHLYFLFMGVKQLFGTALKNVKRADKKQDCNKTRKKEFIKNINLLEKTLFFFFISELAAAAAAAYTNPAAVISRSRKQARPQQKQYIQYKCVISINVCRLRDWQSVVVSVQVRVGGSFLQVPFDWMISHHPILFIACSFFLFLFLV